MPHEIPPIKWVPLDYRRVQHLVTEINALVSGLVLQCIQICRRSYIKNVKIIKNVNSSYPPPPPHTPQVLRCKDDPSYRHDFAAAHGPALSTRAKDLTTFAHRAKQEERSEYVLIAKQVMRFRQLRNSCENELARGHDWQQHHDHEPASAPPPPPPPPPVGEASFSSPQSIDTASTSNNSPQLGRSTPGETEPWENDKARRGSINTARTRLSSPIAMIRNRLRGAAYHMGKMNFHKLFSYYDRDNSGSIDKAEFVSIVRRDGKISIDAMSNQLLADLFDQDIDSNGDGGVTHDEFIQWLLVSGIDVCGGGRVW